jgi:serine protease AprX
MYSTARLVGADKLWAQGVTGIGVGVALIDSGVQASTFFGARLVGGADFSGAGNPLADGYGHGTHMAGIIAGSSGTIGGTASFTGVAPRSTLVSVRVADKLGASSLLKILQGIDWVYKNRLLYNIKVANLSLGVPAYADYTRDPLVAATQRLWYSGVTVVASAGNIGPGLDLTSPAIDPTIIAVGGVDTKGTLATTDDTVAAFSASAASATDRAPTVVVPARSILSLRASGSLLATLAPGSAVGTKFIKGTGTSQAAAVVSGQAALLLSMNPMLGPADIRENLCKFATDRGWDRRSQGCGVANVAAMNLLNVSLSFTWPNFPLATVTEVVDEAADLAARETGLQSSSWQGVSWQGASWQASSWQGVPV